MRSRNFLRGRRNLSAAEGFTLIELLVVIAILAILASLLIPALFQARLLAKRASCQANLHVIGQAAALYQVDYGDYVPICYANLDPNNPQYVNPWKSWRANLLPYLPSFTALNCPAAGDSGKKYEIFHSVDEVKSLDSSYMANAGSYAVMCQASLPTFQTMSYTGKLDTGHPMKSLVFSVQPGVAWTDPANSVYVADGCSPKGPITYPNQTYNGLGAAYILLPSDPQYLRVDLPSRRFADRHIGTNCLFVGGQVIWYKTEVLDWMQAGQPGCVWDVE